MLHGLAVKTFWLSEVQWPPVNVVSDYVDFNLVAFYLQISPLQPLKIHYNLSLNPRLNLEISDFQKFKF